MHIKQFKEIIEFMKDELKERQSDTSGSVDTGQSDRGIIIRTAGEINDESN